MKGSILSIAFAGVLFAAIAVGVYAPRMLVSQTIYGILLFAMLAACIVSLEANLIIIILSAFFLEGLVRLGIIPIVGLWTVDILILLLATRLIIRRGIRRKSQLPVDWVRVVLVLFVGSVVLSGIANTVSPVNILLGLRPYLRFAVLYFCLAYSPWQERFLSACMRLIVLLFVAQMPIQVAQTIAKWDYDLVAGTLGQATGLISVCAMGFIAGLVLYSTDTGRARFLVAAAACVFIPILATARAFLFVLPLVIIYIIVRIACRGVTLKTSTMMVLIAAVTVAAIASWNNLSQGGSSQSPFALLTDPSGLLSELWSPGYVDPSLGIKFVGRFEAIGGVWQLLTTSTYSFGWSLLLGLGPGIAQGSRFFGSLMTTELTWFGSNISQLTKSLTEWGLAGTLLYVACYIINWYSAERIYGSQSDPFWRSVAFGYSTFVLTSLLAMGYTSPWAGTITSFVFWFVGGVLQHVYQRQSPAILPESITSG